MYLSGSGNFQKKKKKKIDEKLIDIKSVFIGPVTQSQ